MLDQEGLVQELIRYLRAKGRLVFTNEDLWRIGVRSVDTDDAVEVIEKRLNVVSYDNVEGEIHYVGVVLPEDIILPKEKVYEIVWILKEWMKPESPIYNLSETELSKKIAEVIGIPHDTLLEMINLS